jgi:hypothetical protein
VSRPGASGAVFLLLLVVGLAAACGGAKRTTTCGNSVGLVPLTDLGKHDYQGFQGGLYPDGQNSPPPGYLALGLAEARKVQPLSPEGRSSPDGTIGFLSVGMSNALREFAAFQRLASADSRRNPQVTIVNGAQAGVDALRAARAFDPYWSVLQNRVVSSGLTPQQVQVVWLKEAEAFPSSPFPDDARHLQTELRRIVAVLFRRFPNLRLVYLSSRSYGGYARTPLNPEPYAYDSGFAVKWLIEERMATRLPLPWVGWGPYLWTDGVKGRSDGFVWTCDDVRSDGTHPSASGDLKIAKLLLDFFTSDPTTRSWFVRQS